MSFHLFLANWDHEPDPGRPPAADDVGMLVSLSQPHFSHYDWDAADADETNGKCDEYRTRIIEAILALRK